MVTTATSRALKLCPLLILASIQDKPHIAPWLIGHPQRRPASSRILNVAVNIVRESQRLATVTAFYVLALAHYLLRQTGHPEYIFLS
jgi:hypothetical protein